MPASRLAAAFLAALALTSVAEAQERLALQPAGPVAVTRDVPFGRADTLPLRMDVYRAEARTSERLPALIFFNRAYGAQERGWEFYANWARNAASRGMVAILPDLRDGGQQHDFTALLAHLRARGGDYGIDTARIAVYAASGNAYTGLPILQAPGVPIQALIVYYGASPALTQLRPELPMLVVRAGLDRPGLNRDLDALVARGLAQNVPISVINDAGGLHGFEIRNDDDASRDAMERTIAFAKAATLPGYQAAVRAGVPLALAAGYVGAGEFARAAATYRDLVAARPDDLPLRLSYAEALLGAGEFARACTEIAPLRGRGLGPRDVGLPGARACAQAGERAQAIAWLNAIPARYLPVEVRDDPAFASLRARADFTAVFERAR